MEIELGEYEGSLANFCVLEYNGSYCC